MQRPHSGASLLATAANTTAVQNNLNEDGIYCKDLVFDCISLCCAPSRLVFYRETRLNGTTF